MLTPQQVEAVLTAHPEPPAIGEDETLATWIQATDLPPAVRAVWTAVLARHSHVLAAYWLGQEGHSRPANRRLVVLTQGSEDTPRLLDTLVAALRANYAGSLRIEAQAVAAGELPIAERRLAEVSPFYRPPA